MITKYNLGDKVAIHGTISYIEIVGTGIVLYHLKENPEWSIQEKDIHLLEQNNSESN